MINTKELAKKLAVQNGLPRADRYDLFLRDFDHKVELIGLVQDPTYDMRDFYGREMLFPKRWVTLGVFDENTKVTV
jgi:hypothetical protein